MIVKLVSGEDGKSHFENVDLKDWHTNWEVDPANGPINFRSREAGFFYDLHNESRRQYVITVSGQGEVAVGDGSKVVLGPGDIIIATDLTGEGHTTRTLGSETWVFCSIPSD